jgi:hypothetical protein
MNSLRYCHKWLLYAWVVLFSSLFSAAVVSPSAAHAPGSSVSRQRPAVAEPYAANELWSISDRRLMRSLDGGLSWEQRQLPNPAAAPHKVWAMPSGGDVFVATEQHGLYRSLNHGGNWEEANQGLPRSVGAAPVSPVVAMAAGPARPDVIYLAAEVEGIYRSEDGGNSWISASRGLPFPLRHRTRPTLLGVDAGDSRWLYALLTVPVHSHLDRVTLFRSADGGRNWIPVKKLGDNVQYDELSVNSTWRVRLTGPAKDVVITDGLDIPSAGAAGPAVLISSLRQLPHHQHCPIVT